mmetsp:Transcript_87463/g.245538  ORF Transcript_87463/g.245538 Transcript_87463/m.245538 type:complete len:233 (-) Transcript_87463:66-764(-)
MFLRPISLAARRKARHHDELRIFQTLRMVYRVYDTMILWRLIEEHDLWAWWVEPLGLPPEIHLAPHVLHHQMRKYASLRHRGREVVIGHTHELSVLEVGDRALLQVDNATDDIASTERPTVICEFVVVGLLPGASPSPTLCGVAEEQRRQRLGKATSQDVLVLGLRLGHLDRLMLENFHLVHVHALADAVIRSHPLPKVLEAILVQARNREPITFDPRIEVRIVRVQKHPWL